MKEHVEKAAPGRSARLPSERRTGEETTLTHSQEEGAGLQVEEVAMMGKVAEVYGLSGVHLLLSLTISSFTFSRVRPTDVVRCRRRR